MKKDTRRYGGYNEKRYMKIWRIQWTKIQEDIEDTMNKDTRYGGYNEQRYKKIWRIQWTKIHEDMEDTMNKDTWRYGWYREQECKEDIEDTEDNDIGEDIEDTEDKDTMEDTTDNDRWYRGQVYRGGYGGSWYQYILLYLLMFIRLDNFIF